MVRDRASGTELSAHFQDISEPISSNSGTFSRKRQNGQKKVNRCAATTTFCGSVFSLKLNKFFNVITSDKVVGAELSLNNEPFGFFSRDKD